MIRVGCETICQMSAKMESATLNPPTSEKDFTLAKQILQTCSHESGECVYDHLADLVCAVVKDRPKDVADYFELFNRRIREDRVRLQDEMLEEIYLEPARLIVARQALDRTKRFSHLAHRELVRDEFLALQQFWRMSGLGLEEKEAYDVANTISELRSTGEMSECRFWGKFFGLRGNYYIFETTLNKNGLDKRLSKDESNPPTVDPSQDSKLSPKRSSANRPSSLPTIVEDEEKTESEVKPSRPSPPDLPQSIYQPPEEVAADPPGSGVNKHAYFVALSSTSPPIELADVLPAQITASQWTKKFLTGNLDHPVASYPTFPGEERHYLRALIARITHGTHVSPIGFYRAGVESPSEEEDEEEEEDEQFADIQRNLKYESLSIEDLEQVDAWCHHQPYLRPEGRVLFSKKVSAGEEEQSEVEEENEKPEETFNGPKILTRCSEDTIGEAIDLWTTRIILKSCFSSPLVLIRSNLWPGAFSFANGITSDCVYFGWGLKFSLQNYSPISLPVVQEEYSQDAGLQEVADPTPEQEAELKKTNEENIEGESVEEEESNESEDTD